MKMRLAGVLLALPLAASLIPGCSKEKARVFEPVDSVPPSATSLRIESVTDTSMAITWRAPGDDQMFGTASSYEMRFATFELNDANWSQGTPVPGMGAPLSPRSSERITIHGLAPGQTYFLALRTADEIPNWSPLSAVINVTVPEAPHYPVLWGGRILPGWGTTSTAFLYRVRLRLSGGTVPPEVPDLLIGDQAYRMRFAGNDGTDAAYEFALRMPVGTYGYRFRFTDEENRTSFLPNPGSWEGPSVEEVQTIAAEFVPVPVDTFRMGNPDPQCVVEERPAHLVALTRPILMDRFEITNAQYCEALNWALDSALVEVHGDTLVRAVVSGATLLHTAPSLEGTAHGIRYTAEVGFTPIPSRENWPVTQVTWFGAAFFCNVRSLQAGLAPAYNQADRWACGPSNQPYAAEGWRLPTEAEWEYVARYPDGRTYPTGNALPVAGVEANFGPGSRSPSPVGAYPDGDNPLGVADLAGNVWEWCNDWLEYYRLVTNDTGQEVPQIDPTGPQAPLTYRVARGGCWGCPAVDLRCARRFGMRPNAAYDGLGFRCVRTTGG